MKASRLNSACTLLKLTLLSGILVSLAALSEAFPPAPHYSIYGLVRDQVGQTIRAEGAEIILLKGNVAVGRTPLVPGIQPDQSYELDIRLDMMRPGTQIYTADAIASQSEFSLAVEMNGRRYYPIEVSDNLKAGKGGERVRLDLTLGEDADRDGLPDVWEQWQLFQAGHFAGENGWDLTLIDRDGDFDKDGQSNWLEYLAGTFAGDPAEFLRLEIREKSDTAVRLEFFGITGKAYSIQRSTDLKTWTRVPFSLTLGEASAESHVAASAGIRSAFTAPAGGEDAFYRLEVR